MATGPNPPAIQAHICVPDGPRAIAFYEAAFAAHCTLLQLADDGRRVLHANLEMFGGEVMLHDEFSESGADVLAPTTRQGASVAIQFNLATPADVDRAIARAQAAGAEITVAPEDQFWGARYGRLRDPFGHVWAFNAPLQTSSG